MSQLIAAVRNWAAAPFSTQMNLGNWALFVGLLMVLTFLWSQVIRHVVAER